MKSLNRWGPFLVVLLGALYIAMAARPKPAKRSDFDVQGFAAFPVVEGGRVQPMDTVARLNLMLLSTKQTFTDEDGVRQPAINWLLDMMATDFEPGPKGENPQFKGPAAKHKVFRIYSEHVRDLLNLEARPGYMYSIDEITPGLERFYDRANAVNKKDEKLRDLHDTQVIELAKKLETFLKLTKLKMPDSIPLFEQPTQWVNLDLALSVPKEELKKFPTAINLVGIYLANSRNDPTLFNEVVSRHLEIVKKELPAETARARYEVYFNSFEPFYHCVFLYVAVFILAVSSWLTLPVFFNRAAFWLCVLTVAVHTWALIARMIIHGRPPITNLYSTAIFIGWGAVLLCLLLEWLNRNSVFTAVAGVIGFITLLIAHNLALGGDTFAPLVAVLDTNFWLSTHVTTVTLGYTATFVAGFISIAYVLFGVLTPWVDSEVRKVFYQAVYGVICFATLLSFVGTMLGGIWADQSWGRFWGWDPKENGALLIVIWNALILHARWGGMIKQRGIASLAILGNIVTAWSWFGVNMLGVGLHSYGFMPGALFWLGVFAISQVLLAAMAMIPENRWLSFQPGAARTRENLHLPGLASR